MESSSKYYAFLAISAILLMGTLANVPNAYAVPATSVDMQYTNSANSGSVFMDVKEKDGVSYNTNPCDAVSPCDTGLTVTHNDVFTVLPITGETTLESETDFFIGAMSFIFNNKAPDTSLHTSWSAPLFPGISGSVTIGPVIHTLTVVSLVGGDEGCRPPQIGGELLPIDTTMVLLAGSQMTAAWMIPVIVAGIGIGIVITRKF